MESAWFVVKKPIAWRPLLYGEVRDDDWYAVVFDTRRGISEAINSSQLSLESFGWKSYVLKYASTDY